MHDSNPKAILPKVVFIDNADELRADIKVKNISEEGKFEIRHTLDAFHVDNYLIPKVSTSVTFKNDLLRFGDREDLFVAGKYDSKKRNLKLKLNEDTAELVEDTKVLKTYYMDKISDSRYHLFEQSEFIKVRDKPLRGAKVAELHRFYTGLDDHNKVSTRRSSNIYQMDPRTHALQMCVPTSRPPLDPNAVERAVQDFLQDEIRLRGHRAAQSRPCKNVTKKDQCMFLNEASGTERCEFIDNICQDNLAVLLEGLREKRHEVAKVDAALDLYHGYMLRYKDQGMVVRPAAAAAASSIVRFSGGAAAMEEDKWPKYEDVYKSFRSELFANGMTVDNFKKVKRQAWKAYYDYYFYLNTRVEREILDRLGRYQQEFTRLKRVALLGDAAEQAKSVTEKVRDRLRNAMVQSLMRTFGEDLKALRARGASEAEFFRAVTMALESPVYVYNLMDLAEIKDFAQVIRAAKSLMRAGDEYYDKSEAPGRIATSGTGCSRTWRCSTCCCGNACAPKR